MKKIIIIVLSLLVIFLSGCSYDPTKRIKGHLVAKEDSLGRITYEFESIFNLLNNSFIDQYFLCDIDFSKKVIIQLEDNQEEKNYTIKGDFIISDLNFMEYHYSGNYTSTLITKSTTIEQENYHEECWKKGSNNYFIQESIIDGNQPIIKTNHREIIYVNSKLHTSAMSECFLLDDYSKFFFTLNNYRYNDNIQIYFYQYSIKKTITIVETRGDDTTIISSYLFVLDKLKSATKNVNKSNEIIDVKYKFSYDNIKIDNPENIEEFQ